MAPENSKGHLSFAFEYSKSEVIFLNLQSLSGEELVVLASIVAVSLSRNQDIKTIKTLIHLLQAVEQNLLKILIQREIEKK